MHDDVVELVCRAVYDAFATQARAPTQGQVSAPAGAYEARVAKAMQELAEGRHLVLDATGEVVMAYPFSAVNLGFSVMGNERLWRGGCAWDSFAIPSLVPNEPRVLVATCGCREPVHPAQAAIRYSWMRPPRRSVLRSRARSTSPISAGGVSSADGDRWSRERCGRWALASRWRRPRMSIRSRHSRLMVPITRSQMALARGARTGLFRILVPSPAKTASKEPGTSRRGRG